MKIINTKDYYKYLKENSNLTKELNRHERNFYKFDSYVKNRYSLKISDKLNKAIDNIDNITNILNLLK